MPAWGLANAGATLVGQNLGANLPARADEAIRIATRFNMIFLGVIGPVFIALSGPIARMFASDAEVLHPLRARSGS